MNLDSISVYNNASSKYGRVVGEIQYYFISQEERDEFNEKVKSARLGSGSKAEQIAIDNRIYKGILMKRRIRNKLKK